MHVKDQPLCRESELSK